MLLGFAAFSKLAGAHIVYTCPYFGLYFGLIIRRSCDRPNVP